MITNIQKLFTFLGQVNYEGNVKKAIIIPSPSDNKHKDCVYQSNILIYMDEAIVFNGLNYLTRSNNKAYALSLKYDRTIETGILSHAAYYGYAGVVQQSKVLKITPLDGSAAIDTETTVFVFSDNENHSQYSSNRGQDRYIDILCEDSLDLGDKFSIDNEYFTVKEIWVELGKRMYRGIK